MTATVLSFLAFLLAFTLVGVLSGLQKEDSPEDYLVARRSVSPWLASLSSVATNNSGFMFVGLIGFTYRDGLQTIWMAVAWILGDLLVWLFVHRRVREVSGRLEANSVPALLGADPGGTQRPVVVLAGLLTFLFLGGYAAAQLQAGATAVHGLFGWEPWLGAVGGALIVVIYCFSGGLRASIWTDAAQAFVMLGSMLLLLLAAVLEVGGPLALHAALAAQDPALVAWVPPDLALGLPAYFLGFLAGGFGAIGQPHILVRSMAIRSAADIPRARRIYLAWFVPFYAAAVLVALYSRVLLPELGGATAHGVDATEAALPALAGLLLPDVLVGLMLAGLFSATMSTADSQILACSAAVTQDVAPRWRRSTRASKLATLGVTALALAIALSASEGVFALVLGAWSILGASLGPVLLLRVTGRRLPTWLALAMMLAGAATVRAWAGGPWAGDVYALLPGLAVPLGLYLGWRAMGRPAAGGLRDADADAGADADAA